MVEEVEIGEGVGLEEVEMTSQIVLVLSGEGREEKQTGNGMSKRKSCKKPVLGVQTLVSTTNYVLSKT